jgi:hypothetical protein
MKLKEYSVEDKCKFFDFMYRVAKEELKENGEEAPNHDLAHWIRFKILDLVTSSSKPKWS